MEVPPIDSHLGMLTYMSGGSPINGRLREKLSDFIVDEVLLGKRASRAFLGIDKFEGGGASYLVVMKRVRMDSFEMISKLSKKLGRRVGYAGMKDARSISFQFISVQGSLRELPEMEGLSLRYAGRGEMIYLGMNDGNHFTVVIRGADTIELPKIFPNFFSYQRFGVKRPYNHEIGKAILLRDIEGASSMISEQGYEVSAARSLKQLSEMIGSELIRFYVHSYQSYIFNLILSRRIELGIGPRHGDFVLRPNGEIALYPERGSLLLPLVGGLTEARGWLAEELASILREEGVSKEMFIFRELPEVSALGDFRKAFCEVEPKIVEREGFIVLSFFLESGAYATSYLREIIKPRDPIAQGFI
ncbi:tRNA pseudouridine(13) synthase TruD [Candidatus Korarchaeum cryptofilum]|uniref:tRNA pseudouridine(13) synthase TruD n=1 Tax=Candidatus Korarchaeum cryptofilum TaxID=498846 RepID=A0A429G4V7_9CREN|nr:tRNA pseudouridine(13) synthase TruD [Candidatus Korarchaeum cryptofilum]RSN68850.1 tRNA pseudouridine(13) synthase TruD [Candidatus Korarchaeum cryptofilum]